MTVDPILLTSSRLKVEIAQPGTVYRGTRFDWSGFITQVTLDDRHTFCMPESLEPGKGTGGIGLCNEFGNELAVGYDEAQIGEPFPKLGIGLLEKPDERRFNFFKPHKIVELFPIRVEAKGDQARFVVEPVECNGYAARLEKTVRIDDNLLHIDYLLENSGEKAIVTHEYCHNFMGIDGLPVGPGYRLVFPQEVKREPPPEQFYRMAPLSLRWLPKPVVKWVIDRILSGMSQKMKLHGREITWQDTPKGAFFSRLQGFQQRTEPQWTLEHASSGRWVSESDDFLPTRLVVWGEAHVVSAEVYVDLNVPPGGRQAWSRRYEFG
jgi:hypothetical protein